MSYKTYMYKISKSTLITFTNPYDNLLKYRLSDMSLS